jgi:hypothetical protein
MDMRALDRGGGALLTNEEATSAPRSGWIGVLPVDVLPVPGAAAAEEATAAAEAAKDPAPAEERMSEPDHDARAVAVDDDDSDSDVYHTRLRIAVHCPDCTNYARIVGTGSEFRNITKLIEPRFGCSVCSWHPRPGECPEKWQVWYAGRLGGTMVFAMNEEHMEVLVAYLETPPKRRNTVDYPWEYRSLMGRLPRGILSGRFRTDMVSLVKRLQRTRPHGI